MSEKRTNYFCNLERTEELNERLFNRNVPITYYNPVFEARSQSTKYQKYPITKCIENNEIKMGYNTKWSDYVSNVNNESALRNQVFPISNSLTNHYVPSSSSELYNKPKLGEENIKQEFPYLFEENKFDSTDMGFLGNMSKDNFYNHTRQQMKNI